MIKEVAIHEPDGSLRSCPGPTPAGHCALQLAAGGPPEKRPVPCAGLTVTAAVLGTRSEWNVTAGATRCFLPAIGLAVAHEPDTGPLARRRPAVRPRAA